MVPDLKTKNEGPLVKDFHLLILSILVVCVIFDFAYIKYSIVFRQQKYSLESFCLTTNRY